MMRKITVAIAMAAALAFAAPALAEESFAVSGSELGSGKDDYTGKVTVTKTGDTWRVVWAIKGDAATTGTGVILGGCCLAVTGIYEGKPFVFLLKADGAKYVGVWTINGETRIGKEIWIPQ